MPRRHHTVPQAYLRAFARGRAVAFRRRDGVIGEANVRKVAVEANFYALGTEPRQDMLLEKWLSENVDGPGERALMVVRRDGLPLSTDDHEALGLTVGFQVARAGAFRSYQRQINEHIGPLLWAQMVVERLAKERPVTLDERKQLMREHYHRAPAAVRQIDDPRSLHRSLVRYADELAHQLQSWNWSILRAERNVLVTSDNPAVAFDTDPSPGWRGVVPPLADIFLPLTPRALLVLSRNPMLGATSALSDDLVAETNRAQTVQATQFVFHHPDMRWPEGLVLASQQPRLPYPRITLSPSARDAQPTFPAGFPPPHRDHVASLLRELGGVDEVP